MGFFRQEYWSGLPFPSPQDLSNPGIEPIPSVSPALQADSLPAEPSGNLSQLLIPSSLFLFQLVFLIYLLDSLALTAYFVFSSETSSLYSLIPY